MGEMSLENSYSYFKNTACKFFPCHKMEVEDFNCMFCYCPLYALGDKCGGNFSYTEDGGKDCSLCLIPHSEKGYSYINSKINDLIKNLNTNMVFSRTTQLKELPINELINVLNISSTNFLFSSENFS